MIVIMKNIVKELSALDYVLLLMNYTPRFAIHAVLLLSASKIIRNIFRFYFKINVQRANWISLPSLPFTVWSPLQCLCDGQNYKNKKVVVFCNLGIFLCVCYMTTRSLCPISIVIKLSGFWILSTFLAKIASSPKFAGF